MNLQRSLAGLPGVQDAGVIMGTDANKELLAHINLVSPEVQAAKPDDLVIVVRGEYAAGADAAIGQVDELLTRRKKSDTGERRPQSLDFAVEQLPDADWVLVSVAGRYAAGCPRGHAPEKHVFLFSDNVPVEEEIALKATASRRVCL